MRDTLHKLAIAKGIGDPAVLAASRVLDQAISKFLRHKEPTRPGDVGHDDDDHSERL